MMMLGYLNLKHTQRAINHRSSDGTETYENIVILSGIVIVR